MNALLTSMLSSMGIDAEALFKTAEMAKAKLDEFDTRLIETLAALKRVEEQNAEILLTLRSLYNERSSEQPGSVASINGSAAGSA